MTSLREDCKERLKVAFDSVRAVSNTLTFILIVDNHGLKVLSNTINYGITIVERLELKRKRISNIEAVYLINPQSYERMLEDYPEDGQPQYKSIHVLSLSKISSGIMEKFTQNMSFAKRVKTLKEINFNFSLHSNNEVKICSYDDKAF
jgi:Sec1 family